MYIYIYVCVCVCKKSKIYIKSINVVIKTLINLMEILDFLNDIYIYVIKFVFTHFHLS